MQASVAAIESELKRPTNCAARNKVGVHDEDEIADDDCSREREDGRDEAHFRPGFGR